MKESPIVDLQLLSSDNIEIGKDAIQMYSKVEERTHANIYTREPLEFAIREHLTNE